MDGASNSVSLPSASTRDVGDGPQKRFRNWPPTSLNKSSPLDGSSELSSELSCVKLNFAPLSADVMEAEFDRWNSRYDIPSVDKAVGRRPERSVVSGDEIRPPDARRAEDEDLSRVKIFFLSCSVHRHQCDGRPCESRTIINAE